MAQERRQRAAFPNENRLPEALETDGNPIFVAGEHRCKRLPGSYFVAGLDRDDKPNGRIDLLLDRPPAAAELQDRSSDPAWLDAGYHAVMLCPEHLNLGRLGEHRRILDHGGISSLGFDDLGQHLKRGTRCDALFKTRARLLR